MARQSNPSDRAWPRPEQGRRRRLAAGLLLAVLAAHAWLLGGTRPHGAPLRPAPATAAVQVRQILEPPPGAAARTPTDPVPTTMPTATAVPALSRPRPRPAPAGMSPPAPPPAARAGPTPEAPGLGTATVPAAPDPPAPAASPPPRYATRLPPAQSLHYTLERGAQSGSAALHWQRDDDGGYELRLDGDFGRERLGRSSRGTLDADGVAPERYVETRRGREQRAVNFQRDKALISFSASVHGQPLWPAAQDRLSWLVQLAAALEADPALRQPGAELRLFVAGTRGDAETWAFEVLGAGPLELPAGSVPDALHLRREPARPWEPQVDLWLDPARHHLPVRLRWLVRPTGEATELRLAATAAP